MYWAISGLLEDGNLGLGTVSVGFGGLGLCGS